MLCSYLDEVLDRLRLPPLFIHVDSFLALSMDYLSRLSKKS